LNFESGGYSLVVRYETPESDAAKHKMRMGNRWFRLAYFGIVVAIFIFLATYLLPAHSELYFQLLHGFGIFAAGQPTDMASGRIQTNYSSLS